MKKIEGFENLTPDLFIHAVETATNNPMTGLLSPLPSYINRVYELQSMDGERFVAKFYRPGRWTLDALIDEHRFVRDCQQDEIPVISPLTLENGKTLSEINGMYFAVFPKRFGREFEIIDDDDWKRMGRVIARMHIAGEKRKAASRLELNPLKSTQKDIEHLLSGNYISPDYVDSFKDVTKKIIDSCKDRFEDVRNLRIHGDCHQKNLIFRPGEGIMIIDFDDMMSGPSVQDLWLLLPDHANRSQTEINLILDGYEQFREFDDAELKLIEPLRAMRIIYFLAWLSKQSNDYQFKKNFPDWGSNAYWKNEITDLYKQLDIIDEHLKPQFNYLA